MTHREVPVDPDEPVKASHGGFVRVPQHRISQLAPATVASWIITAPDYHPIWSQYSLNVIHLRPVEGMPDAVLKQPDMSHELMLAALDPREGQQTPETIFTSEKIPYLAPLNIASQFQVDSDDMACQLGWLLCNAVVHGWLWPETADAPTAVRRAWDRAIADTVDHLKGRHDG